MAKKTTTKKTPTRRRKTTAKARPTSKKKTTSKPKTKAPSALDLAVKVLRHANEPLTTKIIAERVIAAGWQTNGKTPHATLHAAISREIRVKSKDARFKKAERGMFTHA